MAEHQADPGIAKRLKVLRTLRTPESGVQNLDFFSRGNDCTSAARNISSYFSLKPRSQGQLSARLLAWAPVKHSFSASRRSSPSLSWLWAIALPAIMRLGETLKNRRIPPKKRCCRFFLTPYKYIYLAIYCLSACPYEGKRRVTDEISIAWLRFSSDIERSMEGR